MKSSQLLKIGIWLLVFYWYLPAWNFSLAISLASFGVYPPKITITTAPNQNVQVPIRLINGGEGSTLKFSASGLKANEDGSLELISSQDEAFAWLLLEGKTLDKFELKMTPSQEDSLLLSIKIPKNTMEADHYLALVASSENSQSYPSTHSKTTAQIAIPILLSIKEKSEPESLEIDKFLAPQIFFTNQIPITLKLKNPTKHFVTTKGGIIETIGPLGRKSQTLFPKTEILAGQTRIISEKNLTLKTNSFGPTKITVQIPLLNSKNLTAQKTVLIIPVYLLIPAIFAPLLLALAIVSRPFPKP